MKFKLTDGRQKISDLEYLNDLRAVANILGKESLKMRDYAKKNGAKFSISGIIKRFGNWNTCLEKAGLKGEKSLKGIEYGETSIKDEVLLADLLKVSKELKNPNILAREYDEFGKYTSVTMCTRFESWNKAKKKVHLEITNKKNNSIEDLFQNILELWTLFGRQPKYGEVISPNSKFNGSTYARRFGSWTSALKAFIEYINSDNNYEEEKDNNSLLTPINNLVQKQNKIKKKVKIKRTPRGVNLRLRFTVLKRDNFSCKKCGRSPAKDPSVVLHIDHIIPWSKGGETEIENLETLCKDCNLGKSNVL